MKLVDINQEVTFGKYGFAYITGRVITLGYREGGQKTQELDVTNLTMEVLQQFYRSEYIAKGIWKQLSYTFRVLAPEIGRDMELGRPITVNEPTSLELMMAGIEERAAAADAKDAAEQRRLEALAAAKARIDAHYAAKAEAAATIHEEAAPEPEFEDGITTVYICHGSMSLDADYLEEMADGKGEVQRVKLHLTAAEQAELHDLNGKVFDSAWYWDLVFKGDAAGANEYWEACHKCVPVPKYGFNW